MLEGSRATDAETLGRLTELLVVDQAQVPEAAVEQAIEGGCARPARPVHARRLGAGRGTNPMLVVCDSRRRHAPAPVRERAGWRRAEPVTVPGIRARNHSAATRLGRNGGRGLEAGLSASRWRAFGKLALHPEP